jgi:hypothetical protein
MQRTRDTGSVNKLAAAVVTAPVMPEPVMEFFRTTGRIGGSAKTEAKAKAARRNGKLGGRPDRRLCKQMQTLPTSEVRPISK